VVINQWFYPSIHVHQDLTISISVFHCFQLPQIPACMDSETGVALIDIAHLQT